MQHCNKYQNNQDLSLPSGSDILPIYWSCRVNAIYDLPINLRYIHKRVPPLDFMQYDEAYRCSQKVIFWGLSFFSGCSCVICMCTFCILCTSITRQSAHRQSPTDCIELEGVCVIGGSVSANTLALGQRHNLELTKGEGDSDENKKYKYPKHMSRCLKISHSQILRSHHPVQECKMQTPSAHHHIG